MIPTTENQNSSKENDQFLKFKFLTSTQNYRVRNHRERRRILTYAFLGPEAYQCAFTSDLKRLLIISLDGTYHRYRLRISKQQDPLHEHTVNFLNTT